MNPFMPIDKQHADEIPPEVEAGDEDFEDDDYIPGFDDGEELSEDKE